jgi:hypothetical protein
MSKQNGNVPVATLRNRRIKAAIWENHSPKGVFYSVTVVRSFKEGEKWRDSHSFGHNELLIAAKLMYDAHTAISAMMEKVKPLKQPPAAPMLPIRGRAKA